MHELYFSVIMMTLGVWRLRHNLMMTSSLLVWMGLSAGTVPMTEFPTKEFSTR